MIEYNKVLHKVMVKIKKLTHNWERIFGYRITSLCIKRILLLIIYT